jgi:threonine dehydrogenase-like Zn-dependent dehydrogenase
MVRSRLVPSRVGFALEHGCSWRRVALKELIEADKITPVIDRRYPLRDVPEAIRYLDAGHARGKVVITSETWQLRSPP